MKGILPLVVCVAAMFFIHADFSSERTCISESGYDIGDQAEDFMLENYDGTQVSLSSYKDVKGYVIVFTSNHCPYAEAYEDRLVALHRKFAEKGFPIIAINPNAPEASEQDNAKANCLKARLKRFPFPYLSDSLQQVFPKFGATRTPHVFILDANRIVKYIGTVDDNAEAPQRVKKRYVEDAISKLIHGEDPAPSITMAVGCVIRRVPRDSSGRIKLDKK